MFARHARRPREVARVGVAAVQRVHVLHLGRDVLELVARLQRVLAAHPGVVQLRVAHVRVLPLRVRRLAAEVGVAGDQLRVEAAGDARVGRQPGDAVRVLRRRRAERPTGSCRPRSATSRSGPSSSDVPVRAHVKPVANCLVVDVREGVAGAARRQRHRRVVEGVHLAVAVAREQLSERAELEVDLAAALVLCCSGSSAARRSCSTRRCGSGSAGRASTFCAKEVIGIWRAGRVDLARHRVPDVHRQDALPLRRRREWC